MAEFGFDPKMAVRHLKTADPALGGIIAAVGPFTMQLKSSRSLFGALAEAIVYQQLSNKAAATIYSRVEGLFPRAKDGFTPRHILAATDDPLGLGPHSVDIYKDWTAAKKPAELHLYSKGGHGFGMRKQNLPTDHWIERFADWLEAQGM